ncbi:NAD-dependent epimerase/dehydratase family protein [Paractinoplanes maris]|uniref:NAD-dependent epimerase/dehydratase family protein n=1 Tax=Paractinoplanes maris TaxID=1734446 RepID=UPI0020212BEC|nr:NAD(P)-dependent oxidoreductase [Actinoplanes maris]
MGDILLTGAAGRIGRMLRARLSTRHSWRFTDLRPEPGVAALDVTDADAVARACEGVDTVVHLAGLAGGGSFDEVLESNVRGTENVFRTGVARVVLASSNHAAGFYSRADALPDGLPDDVTPRPDSYYGWSKAATESLARLYHDRCGTHVVCLRIGACFERPRQPRDLSLWLSPDDAGRLVEASLQATGFHVVWGISANRHRWFSARGARDIGYVPRDDAADHLLGEPDLTRVEQQLVGGTVPARPLTG